MPTALPKISTEALQLFTGDEAFFYRIVPYAIAGEGVVDCFCDEARTYDGVVAEISDVFGFRPVLHPVSSGELTRLLSSSYRQSDVRTENASFVAAGQDFVGEIVGEAYDVRSSDIHLEPSENRCRVRFRIDGRLVERHVIKKEDYPGIVNRIKIMSNLDISEKRLPQDGRIKFSRGAVHFDIRTSVMPTIYGEKIVLRLLASNGQRPSLEELGFDSRQLGDYLDAVSRQHGLVLLSGPTGSGKSTTLYATLERLNRGDNNILTIEDPIEYTIEGINQVQLKEEIGLTFPVALRTFLRQDPDIIMLGEIRDEQTAEMAIRSSLTGHLLLSTLHTNSAWGCISRLADMGVHPFLIAETLTACVAQRLVRLLCPHCKSSDLKPVGCPRCHYTGYLGRRAIYEVIRIDGELSEAVRQNRRDIEPLLRERNIRTLEDAAMSLYKSGETSLEEISPLLSSIPNTSLYE